MVAWLHASAHSIDKQQHPSGLSRDETDVGAPAQQPGALGPRVAGVSVAALEVLVHRELEAEKVRASYVLQYVTHSPQPTAHSLQPTRPSTSVQEKRRAGLSFNANM